MTTTAYLAAEGFEAQLADELAWAGIAISAAHGRLLVTDAASVASVWAANVWYDAEEIAIASIGAAAKELRARQRNWAVYAPAHRGRATLVVDRLPHVSGRALAIGEPTPNAPLGSWTLLAPDRILVAAHCASPFANGEPHLLLDHDGPPSRAYVKLWEALLRLGRWPARGERCIDLGASPGGWTWLLAQTGAHVHAVDKAPLDGDAAALPGVTWSGESAFALDPRTAGRVDWLCSDVVAYPNRLYGLVTQWIEHGDVGAIVSTVKFQGATDQDVVRRFAALPGATVAHLHHNRHEVTFLWTAPT